MAVTTASEWKVFIGPPTTIDRTTEQSAIEDFEGISPWTEIKEVENLGEFGDEAADVTFTSLADGRVRHFKGPRDAGVIALTIGRDPLDEGQQALIAAEKTKFQYPFRIIAADAASNEYSDSVFYFEALVQSARINAGAADNVVRINANLGIVTEIIEVTSELISS
jgi:hypothetical protein